MKKNEVDQDPNEQVFYIKEGRRYKRIPSWDFPSRPAAGIWLVGDSERRLIMRLGDMPTVSVAAAFARHSKVICDAIMSVPAHGPGSSAYDIAQAIIKAVATAEDNELLKQNIRQG